MTRLCLVSSWFCNCLAVALLVVGLVVVPEQALADGGTQQAPLVKQYPCGGITNSGAGYCAVFGGNCLLATYPNCSGQSGCNKYMGECSCTCQSSNGTQNGAQCGCY